MMMPLQTNDEKKLEWADKYAPEEPNRFILFPTKSEALRENPKLPTFRGYLTDAFGNVYEVAGWRNKSEKGNVTLSGNVEKINLVRLGGEEYPNKVSNGNQDGSKLDDDIPF